MTALTVIEFVQQCKKHLKFPFQIKCARVQSWVSVLRDSPLASLLSVTCHASGVDSFFFIVDKIRKPKHETFVLFMNGFIDLHVICKHIKLQTIAANISP